MTGWIGSTTIRRAGAYDEAGREWGLVADFGVFLSQKAVFPAN